MFGSSTVPAVSAPENADPAAASKLRVAFIHQRFPFCFCVFIACLCIVFVVLESYGFRRCQLANLAGTAWRRSKPRINRTVYSHDGLNRELADRRKGAQSSQAHTCPRTNLLVSNGPSRSCLCQRRPATQVAFLDSQVTIRTPHLLGLRSLLQCLRATLGDSDR